MNQFCGTGRLTRDPELKSTSTGGYIVTFSIAMRRSRPNNNGEYRTDFVDCYAWAARAEFIGNYGRKGALVEISGQLRQNTFTNERGHKISQHEIEVNHFRFLDGNHGPRGKTNAVASDAIGEDPLAPIPPPDELPF